MSDKATRLLELIQEERNAFVHAEYGRLQSVMGSEYTENGRTHIFHPLPEAQKGEEQISDNPKALSLEELAMLPHLVRAIPRLGTMSYMPLFQASPYEAERLRLLADMQEKLLIGRPCTPEEELALQDGHAAYMASKKDDDVLVIK